MSRAFVACLMVLGALALLAPASALAGGPSAGDQQYIDPLAGSSHHGSSHSHSSGSGAAPSTTPAPTASSTPSVSSSSTSSSATSTTPTSSSSKPDPKGLPTTGFDALLAAFVGAFLLASGVLLRRAARGS